MILTSSQLLTNYIYFKKRKVNLSVQLTIVLCLKRFVGTDTLAKIASEAAAKGISEVKAVDISEKNSSSSSFDGFSSQQLTTPTTDPTLPSNTHYVLKNEEKKDVYQQHKEMQKQNYTADASIKKAEEHKKLQQDQGSSSEDNKPKITIGAGAGVLIALEHHKRNLESNNNQMNESHNTASSITSTQQSTTPQNAEGKLIDQDVTEAKTPDSKIIDQLSTDQQISETIPNEQGNTEATPNTSFADSKIIEQDVSETSKPDSNTASESNFNDSNKENKDNQQPPKSDQSLLAEKEDEIDKKALEKKVQEEEEHKQALEEHKNNLKKALEDIKKLGKDENNNNYNHDNNDENNNNNNDNIKPDKIPNNMKGFYKSQSGKKYTTEITVETAPDNISDMDLIEEMKKRELIKNDPGNTSTSVKTENNNQVIVGLPKNNIKLTQLGHSYSKSVEENKKDLKNPASKDMVQEKAKTTIPSITNQGEFTENYSKQIAFEDLMIVTPPPGNGDLFIETGLQKHLIVVYSPSLDKYIATHYLTSKHSATMLCEKQFKIFQNEQENPGKIFTSKKTQHIVPLDAPFVVDKEEVFRVKNDKEYLEQVTEDVKSQVRASVNDLIKEPAKEFNKSGITKQDAIKMCLEHDEIVKKGGKHPLTSDQIKQNEENKKKQLEENELKTVENNKYNNNYVSKD